MKCLYCKSIVEEEINCPNCGAPLHRDDYSSANNENKTGSMADRVNSSGIKPLQLDNGGVAVKKSRNVYILLALFSGLFGVHNFYAGYKVRGIVQLILTLCLWWSVVVPLLTVIWILIEISMVIKGVDGDIFE